MININFQPELDITTMVKVLIFKYLLFDFS